MNFNHCWNSLEADKNESPVCPYQKHENSRLSSHLALLNTHWKLSAHAGILWACMLSLWSTNIMNREISLWILKISNIAHVYLNLKISAEIYIKTTKISCILPTYTPIQRFIPVKVSPTPPNHSHPTPTHSNSSKTVPSHTETPISYRFVISVVLVQSDKVGRSPGGIAVFIIMK